MIPCPRCGASNNPVSKFCASCGAAVSLPAAGSPVSAPGASAAGPPGWGPPPTGPGPGAPPYGPPHMGAPVAASPAGPPGWGGPAPGSGPQYGVPAGSGPGMAAGAPVSPGGWPQAAAAQQPAMHGDPRARFGAAAGLNPYAETMAPDPQMLAPAAAQPPGYPAGGPPGGAVPPVPAHYAGGAVAGPAGAAFPPGMPGGAMPPGGMAPGVPAHAQMRWNDPSAFAATAPPPTAEELEAARRAAQQLQDAPTGPQPSQTPPPADASSAAPPAAEPSGQPPAASPHESAQVAQDAPRVLAGFLVSYEDTEQGLFWPVYQGQTRVGRAGAGEALDIEIDHPTTSSHHAVIFAAARPGRLQVQDMGSTNGTFLAGEKLSYDAKHELTDGVELRFGGYPVIVKIV